VQNGDLLMHNNDRSIKQADKLLKMPGKMDRGPVDFKSHIVENEGEVMAIASHDVISVPQTMSIQAAVETMTEWGVRRLPVVDAGTRRIKGIIASGDVINFMGGGEKFRLVTVKHNGNFIAAVNESVREIMTGKVETLAISSSLALAVSTIVTKKIGGLPVVDNEGVLRGILTERDVLKVLRNQKSTLLVEDIMSKNLRATHPECTIGNVTRSMSNYRFRRLPVVSDDVLYGIITTTDIVRYLGSGKVFRELITGDAKEVMDVSVRELISGDLYTTTPEKNINEVACMMLSKNVGAMPVISDSRLIGLLTEYDLLKALMRV